ncbi:UNVERIFIED_ORG: hypothetical protein FHU00_3953 [Citrobacter freundii]
MSIIRFTDFRGTGDVMVIAERITHFHGRYGYGSVIKLDTGMEILVSEMPDEVQRRIEQAQKDT